MKMILASESPRRRELLQKLGLPFEAIPSHTDEHLEPNLTVEEQAKQIAYHKAKEVFDTITGNKIVIGADTMVVKNGKIYGKAKEKEIAIQMLKELKNTTHQVITGLVVLIQKDGIITEKRIAEVSNITIANMTDQEIQKWVNSGKALDKAGAYGIQEEFCVHVEKIEGDYTNIIGLPMHALYEMIKSYI